MNRKPGEFPPRPITQTVVDEEAGWDWHKGACPICGGEALKCDERSPLLLKVACPTCQRYTLEPEAANQLKAYQRPRPGDPDRIMDRLSRYCADADEPVELRQGSWLLLAERTELTSN